MKKVSKKYHWWADEDIDTIVTLYISGRTKKQIAEKYGTTLNSIEYCLTKAKRLRSKR